MEQVILKKVLDEILVEMKEANQEKEIINSSLEKLSKVTELFDEKLMKVRLQVPNIDTVNMEGILKNHLQTAKLDLQLHFCRVSKLQETKTVKEKIFYWFPWLLVIILCAILFRIATGGHFSGSVF